MRQSPRYVWLVAAAAALSLAGLLSVQVVLLNRSLEFGRAAFRLSVDGALASVVAKLEARETIKRVWTVSFDRKGGGAVAVVREGGERPTVLAATAFVPKVQADGPNLLLTLGVPQRVRVVVVGPLGSPDPTVLDETRPPGRSEIPVARLAAGAPVPGPRNHVRLLLDDVPFDVTIERGAVVAVLAHPTVDQSRAALIDRVLEQFMVVTPVPVQGRVTPAEVSAAVTEALAERGIGDACAWGVVTSTPPAVVMASDGRWTEALLASPLSAVLFPNDVAATGDRIALHFPGRTSWIVPANTAPLAVAALFVLAAAACLGLLLKTVVAQRRLAAALSEFVGNMTHEFKTPIAAIALASDALGEEAVARDPGRQAKYRGLIRRECGRMRDQVQQILEMAAIDGGDLEVARSRVDLHEVARLAAEPFAAAAEARGGSLTLDLRAERPILEGDPLHLQNVLRNLLDNAIKYSRGAPRVRLETSTHRGRLRVLVSDNGIGIAPADRERVFEKYYRVPTGNVRDVSGFGLGLSYVAAVARLHGASVSVESEPGRGSVFRIDFAAPAPGLGAGAGESLV